MSDTEKQAVIKWLEDTVSALQLQIDLAEGIGESTVCISVEKAKHYLGLCKVLIDLNKESKDGGN